MHKRAFLAKKLYIVQNFEFSAFLFYKELTRNSEVTNF